MKYTYLKICTISFLILAGCENGLDLVPKDAVSDVSFWKTSEDFKRAANNLYNSLPGFSYADNQSDITTAASPNSISNGTLQTSETDAIWNDAFVYIRACNIILSKAKESSIAADLKPVVAEAKFFRAFNYWKLFVRYGEVPIIDKELDIKDELLYAPRATSKETVDFILKDLDEAIPSLPNKSKLASGDMGRITDAAGIALKARIALFVGTWGKYRNDATANMYIDLAIDAAKTIMNTAQFSLYTGKGADSYRNFFLEPGDDSPETIFDRRYAFGIQDHGFARDAGYGAFEPTKKLADMYLCADGLPIDKSPMFKGYNEFSSEFQNRDPRMTMTFVIPGKVIKLGLYPLGTAAWPFYPQRNPKTGYTTYKFVSEDPVANAMENRYTYDNHIIRYAEILLIYAEALFEKNGSISDEDLNKSINLIRARAGMPALTNAFVSANGLNMRTEIRRERTIELAMEGFRYDDLRRWKTAETELPTEMKGIKIVGTPWAMPIIIEGQDRNPYKDPAYQTKTDANGFMIVEPASTRSFNPIKAYLLPLPTKEILINPKLVQNPNW